MSEWRMIDSAPRDGTPIDLWCSMVDTNGIVERNTNGRFADAWFDVDSGRWAYGDDEPGYLYETGNFSPQEIESLRGKNGWKLIVTHWMPIPEPPR